MKKIIAVICLALFTTSCVVIPIDDHAHSHQCLLSSDRKVLKVIDVAKESNSYYSISGIILSPILIPTSAIISGTYVLVNNSYHLGEETIKCES
ncbi:hypothetical protein [Colwellia sp. MEBiC06753]